MKQRIFNVRRLIFLFAAIISFGLSSLVVAEEIWVDVRSQQEWDSGHLEQATLIPHTEIADKIASLTENKDAEIKLYCRSGGRAGKAKAVLEALGYTNVENVGGYEDAKKRVAKSE